MNSTLKVLIGSLLAATFSVPAFAISEVPGGWQGGFKNTNPDFSYVRGLPDLSDLEITGNLDNIDKLTRMQRILWPEFSWQSIPGDESSRVYEMFARDISRMGYDDSGRIWSIICPQRAIHLPPLGTVMLEVTVTGVRGWADEPSHSAFANIGVRGNVWIQPDPNNENPLVAEFAKLMTNKKMPISKENAIQVIAHSPGKPYEEFWPMVNGTDPMFFHPSFTQHWDKAFSVYNLQVEMGKQILTGDKLLDSFNAMILKLLNLVVGNMLTEGNKVAWNVWAGAPEIVDIEEWQSHADKWHYSIDVKHEYPTGDTGGPTYFDGTPFVPNFTPLDVLKVIKEFISDNWLELQECRAEISESSNGMLFGFIKDHLFDHSTYHIGECTMD